LLISEPGRFHLNSGRVDRLSTISVGAQCAD
jgi:hypothetical protein